MFSGDIGPVTDRNFAELELTKSDRRDDHEESDKDSK
jgi:hypothetical protein